MSEEIKEYTFEKTFDVKFDESALKTFNDLIKEKGIRHFKLESDLYGVLDVVSYEEYEKLQQKVEQLEKENKELNRMCELYGQSLYNADLTKAEKKVEQLENIRKEAITYILAHCEIIRHEKENIDEVGNVNGADLLNILNKGGKE